MNTVSDKNLSLPSAMERFFIWLGGYTPKNIQHYPPQFREPISKIGASVSFAATISACNWGIAGWSFLPVTLALFDKALMSLIVATIGAAVVLVIDRQFVYTLDTDYHSSVLKSVFYTIIRVSITLALSSITATAVLPVVMGSDLNIQALQMQENAERNRTADLNSQFELSDKASAMNTADRDVKDLENALVNLPVDIQNKLENYGMCWKKYRQQKSTLIANGWTAKDARNQLISKASACHLLEVEALRIRDDYLSNTREQLDAALNIKQKQQATLDEANREINQRLQTAHEIEAVNYNARSTDVLWQTLKTKPGALVKYIIINFLLIAGELLPLILKGMNGKTVIGRQIALEKHRAHLKLTAEMRQYEHDFQVGFLISDTSNEAVKIALKDASTRAMFADKFSQSLRATAPLEAVRAMMRDLEERAMDVDTFISRHPQYAQVISQAWGAAIQETMRILSTNTQSAWNQRSEVTA